MAIKMKKEPQSIFERFCLDSSILGLKYLYLYPNVVSRLFWTSIIVCVTMFACLLSYSLYLRFDAMPTRITIENQYEPVNGLPFPAITLCSPNQITLSATRHFNRTLVNGNRTMNLEHLVRQLTGFFDLVLFDTEALQELEMLMELNRYSVPEMMALLTQKCDRYLKLCFFHQRRYNCNELFKPILTHHGFCCIFNSMYSFKDYRRNEADPKFRYHKITATSLARGLTVVTDFEPEDALDETVNFGGASRLIVSPWNEFPSDDHSALVVTGAEVFFSLSATHTYCSENAAELPWHIRECYFQDEYHLRFFNKYHNSECDHLCYAATTEKICHCQLYHLPQVRLSRICNITSLTCIAEVKSTMNRQESQSSCDCPRDCDSLEYSVDMSIGNLDALPYLYSYYLNEIHFNKSTSLIHIFFPGPVYVKKKQETVMSITTLASNLGGVFGLCLGCSVMSAFEILFYCYISIRNKVRNKIRQASMEKEKKIRIPYIN